MITLGDTVKYSTIKLIVHVLAFIYINKTQTSVYPLEKSNEREGWGKLKQYSDIGAAQSEAAFFYFPCSSLIPSLNEPGQHHSNPFKMKTNAFFLSFFHS